MNLLDKTKTPDSAAERNSSVATGDEDPVERLPISKATGVTDLIDGFF